MGEVSNAGLNSNGSTSAKTEADTTGVNSGSSTEASVTAKDTLSAESEVSTKENTDSTDTGAGTDADIDAEALLMEAQGVSFVAEDDLVGPSDSENDNASEHKTETVETEKETKTAKSKEKDANPKEAEVKEESKSNTEAKKDTASEKKTAPSESKAETKPPKDFVPIQALHEARGENRYLKNVIADLQKKTELQESSKSTETVSESLEKPEPDFDILSASELETLIEDEPAEALKYSIKLQDYKDKLREYEQTVEATRYEEERLEQKQQELAELFRSVNNQMEEYVPDLFNKESDAQKELATFADTLGFSEDMYYLTNPETQVILPGESEPLYLGEQAASIIKLLTTARSAISEAKANPEQLEKDIRAKVEAELTKKFKSTPANTFRSLNEVPNTDKDIDFQDKVLSAEAFGKLSEAEKEVYLAGG